MEIFLNNKPLMISYPRSGSHWINAMLECYLEQPRYPKQINGLSFLRNHVYNNEYYGSFVHDKLLNIVPPKTLHGNILLVRDPVDAIFSLKSINSQDPLVAASIEQLSMYWKLLHEKWTDNVKTIIYYEKSVKNPIDTLKLLSDHFKKNWNVSKAQETIELCGKKKTIMTKMKNIFHNENVLKEEYKQARKLFRNKHQKTIYEIVETEKIKSILKEVKNEH